MYTECPTCNTLFHVHASQLAVAGGRVRCGECLAVFDAREYLREDLGNAEPAAASLPDPQIAPPSAPASRPVSAPATPKPLDAERGGNLRGEKVPPRKLPKSPPPSAVEVLELELDRRPVRSSSGIWLIMSVLLLLMLGWQYAYYDRARLAAVPALRPALEEMCRLAHCSLEPVRSPGAFELTGRSVQSHPSFAGALLIDATFVNRAAAAVPYPQLEVVFTDTEGTPVAGRRFLPSEYLGAAPQQALAPGTEAHAVLELLDPGDQAVGYEFRFF